MLDIVVVQRSHSWGKLLRDPFHWYLRWHVLVPRKLAYRKEAGQLHLDSSELCVLSVHI